ncbi:MAG TPA: bifunctional DNA-binding transcriptional regulator/O6-methylguanine-DNA methyltransferase Ada [Chthoniobacteraceae bacterium]|nr:bifunctional DNA-binding transcriptional regulator/O6-methylguanine-DNA methyltransferase Ada [Chthoniobacteraceae bacterium]
MSTLLKAKNNKTGPRYASENARWRAVVQRDPRADGHFFYSVRTTKIYCVPSCSAPHPLRKNVAFHDSAEDAERAGFRPCKRCAPHGETLAELRATAIARACRLIETSDVPPKLEALARAAGMSAFHFHRIFKSLTGLTPKKYATAHRTRRVRTELTNGRHVTQAIYNSGYNSNGSFYANAPQALGMTPSRFRNGGTGTTIQFSIANCPLGLVLVAASEIGVCAIYLGDHPEPLRDALEKQFPRARLVRGNHEFTETVARVVAFIKTPAASFDLPLDIRGTAFQQRVWDALRQIPLGKTVSYRELATQIGAPKAIRAVARACAANAIAVAIPCHRVVRSNGALSGYRWGPQRKDALLAKEKAEKLKR